MKRNRQPLMLRMFWTYVLVLAIGVTLLELQNIFVLQIPFHRLLTFNIPAVCLGAMLFVLLLQAGTAIRLREFRRYNQGDGGISKQMVLWRLLKFPKELFIGVIALSLLFSFLYHLISILRDGEGFHIFTNSTHLQRLLYIMLTEQLLALTLATMLFSFSRSALRPYILSLQAYAIDRKPNESLVRTVLTTMACTFAITFFSVLKYVLVGNWYGKPFEVGVLAGIILVYMLFSLGVMALLLVEYRTELRLMTEGFHRLAASRRLDMHGKLSVMSPDEVGQLTAAFNGLQERMLMEYEELDKELRLAYKVQQQLFPKLQWDLGMAEASAECIQHKEVGGDLFDIAVLDEDRFIVIVGDVSGKGMPAALVMSAVLTLFRTEVKYGGSAEELVSRLNLHLVHTLQGSMYVTLGLALFDRTRGLEYVSAGHMAPYLIRGNRVQQLQVSSLPLGVDSNVRYSSQWLQLAPGDRMLFYTDGVVEGLQPSGQLFGFEQLEQLLGGLSAGQSLCDQLLGLSERITLSNVSFRDDRTLVMLRWNGSKSGLEAGELFEGTRVVS